jgi:hypothetical protein
LMFMRTVVVGPVAPGIAMVEDSNGAPDC